MKIHSQVFPYFDSAAVFDTIAAEDWAIFLDSGVIPHRDQIFREVNADVLAMRPIKTLVTQGETTTIQTYDKRHDKTREKNGDIKISEADPIELLRSELSHFDMHEEDAEHGLAYLPGALGYFSYDLARRWQALPDSTEDEEQLPQMAMGLYEVVLVVDHRKRKSHLVRMGDSESALRLEAEWLNVLDAWADKTVERALGEPPIATLTPTTSRLRCQTYRQSLDDEQYHQGFARVQHYLREGDCYQINLTKQFSAKVDVEGDAWQTYRYLRVLSPAPYGAYMRLPFAQVLSNSPESFLYCANGEVTTSPIKGTMPRDHNDPEKDLEIARQLYYSEKNRAENVMIVDLMRNDLGRVCVPGSIEVPNLFAVHSFANVHHLISTVSGQLAPEYDCLDLLKICFPGGSITGAPKLRAMEIIEELESCRRGLYCGSIAYVGVDGKLVSNIAIRTITIKDQVARFSAGGGLVTDSKVEVEHQEIEDKASIMKQVLFSS